MPVVFPRTANDTVGVLEGRMGKGPFPGQYCQPGNRPRQPSFTNNSIIYTSIRPVEILEPWNFLSPAFAARTKTETSQF
jgi:hypothetical protein